MRVRWFALLLISLTFSACTEQQARQARKTMEQESQAVESAVAKVSKALVRIHVVVARYSDGRSLKNEGSGSGVVISPDGYIVTNHHVAGDAIRLLVTMPTREEIPAELVGTDAMSDIAVIKLTPPTPRQFDYANFGDSDKLQVGDPVLAMGSPLSLSQSITQGIVSNTQMTMPALYAHAAFELDGENVGSIVRWIGHDAAIFPGNSGGPLVNLKGEVIGINEISLGLAGAIPGNLARDVSQLIIKHKEVDRAFLGFLLQPVFKHTDKQQGAIVSDVVEDSPAAQADIRPGDRLLKIGDKVVNAQFAEDLPPINLFIASLPIGQPVQVSLIRDDKTSFSKTLTPIKREKVQTRQREFAQWGLTGRNLSIWTALEMKRPNKDGVLLTSIADGGPAGQAKPALQEGDVLLQLNGQPVRSMEALTSQTAQLTHGKSEAVPTLVTFARQGQELVTVVEVGIEDLNDPGKEVVKAWVPVATQVISREMAEQLKLGELTGVRVTQLYDGQTTGSFSLKVGDLIVGLDGEPIPASEPQDNEVFPTMVRQYAIGTSVTLSVLREGQPLQLSAKLPARPPQPREMPRYQDRDFDFTARDVAYIDRMNYRWEDQPAGVLIENVEEGGWAALGRLSAGDLLMEIDGQPVRNVNDLKAIMEKIKAAKKTSVIFKVRRGIHNLFIELEPLWKAEA